MNRNTMYDCLFAKGIKTSRQYIGRGYHIIFNIEPNQECDIVFDWGYIRGVQSIRLFTNECVIESRWEDMKVNVYYKDIDKFEVRLYEEQESKPL